MTNVIMILSDELRADALGYMGNDVIKTPNIDTLSEDAVVFGNAYCNTPMCVPSRVSISTGRYAHSHGALDNMLSPLNDEVSFYQLLRDKGYATFNHGKWHCNIDPVEFGVNTSRGGDNDTRAPEKFVTCFGITDSATRQITDYKRNYGEVPLIISGSRPSHKDDTLDSVVTDNFLEDLKSHYMNEQPIFARLSIMDPHTPYMPAEPYASMYKPDTIPMPSSMFEDLTEKPVMQRYFRKVRGFDKLLEEDYRKSKASYYGLVSHVDDRIGKVLDSLKVAGIYDDSLILFMADHGSMMGEHGFVEKWGHMYEEVMRIPMMIKLPKNLYGGKRLNSFVESVDVMPTLLDCLGMKVPDRVQGKSMMPYIEGESDWHKEEIYGQYYCGSLQNESALMVRDSRWKLTSYPEGNQLEGFLLNDHQLKMTEIFDQAPVYGELYDMEADPKEMNNLFDHPDYTQVKRQYLQKLNIWMENLEDMVDTATMLPVNDLSLHVIKQGENMISTQDRLRGEKRWGKLARK